MKNNVDVLSVNNNIINFINHPFYIMIIDKIIIVTSMIIYDLNILVMIIVIVI